MLTDNLNLKISRTVVSDAVIVTSLHIVDEQRIFVALWKIVVKIHEVGQKV